MTPVNKKFKQHGSSSLALIPSWTLGADLLLGPCESYVYCVHYACCLCDLFHAPLYSLSMTEPLRDLHALVNKLLNFLWFDKVHALHNYEPPLTVINFNKDEALGSIEGVFL